MKPYVQYSAQERAQEYAALCKRREEYQNLGLKLNMARGKPGTEQLDIVSDLMTVLQTPRDCIDEGIDVRNYGELTGIPSAKRLFAELLGTKPEEILVGGNASLNLMYDLIAKAYTHGLLHSQRPWSQEKEICFLCPAPGYDRHFKVSESFGMKLITIAMTDDGPDMDAVEEAVKNPAVKGMWCVPKYANPDGIIYSEETENRIAALRPAAPDFALMWDNAYCIHEFFGEFVPFRDMLTLCRENGNADMVYEFASTSKITLPGAGVSCMAASAANQKYIESLLTMQIISYDKVNQLRHVRYLKDKETTLQLMKEHAKVLAPKFAAVLDALDSEIAPLEIARWTRPNGGYFVSLNAMEGTAKRTLALCRETGVVMTPAGATFPYGIDPADSNIRIAPTLPPVAELKQAMEVFCLCLRIAALEKLGV
ncbi:MAG: aminotransferase class I/II-fold pyridoxal phosphate-dependent enzyme [Oscillospiraceae bacterium]|jgi:DNA-binding transcriptional MocR family regulator|nr:aminotransferase class I/II-fold pyridoxal phosphate-dependent enzyme [Oscillospiraceae bacterium]